MSAPIASATKLARPLISRTPEEARRRILKLYKLWYRRIPILIEDFSLPLSIYQYRELLRKEFTHQRDIKDLRAYDLRLIKAEMQFREISNHWGTYSTLQEIIENIQNQRGEKKPQDFVSKFLAGQD